jgi:hypothetical protein
MTFPVIYCRWVGRTDPGEKPVDGHWYVRRVELPIPPFVGMGVILSDGFNDPFEIEQVYINLEGDVICIVEGMTYSGMSDDEWPGTLAYETEGWDVIGGRYPPGKRNELIKAV